MTGSTAVFSITNQYSKSDLLFDLKGYFKAEQNTSSVAYYGDKLITMDIDWMNAQKVSELPTDKSKLADEIDFYE